MPPWEFPPGAGAGSICLKIAHTKRHLSRALVSVISVRMDAVAHRYALVRFNISPGWHFSSRNMHMCPQIYAHVPHEFLFGGANLSIPHKIYALGTRSIRRAANSLVRPARHPTRSAHHHIRQSCRSSIPASPHLLLRL